MLLFACAVNAQTSLTCLANDDGFGCKPISETTIDGILAPGFHAFFEGPTDRYQHGILGDKMEWSELTILQQGSPSHGPNFSTTFTLSKSRVFEDIQPRIADITGDGQLEVIVIETDVDKGAQLAVYGHAIYTKLHKIAATPHIGTSHRWLAPVGIADFNGDGDMDIAYIDRPHLAQVLRVWSYRDGKLVEIANTPNLTNHKIGWNFIAGGVRNCGVGPEMITADGAWRNVISTLFEGGKLVSRKIGTYKGPDSLKAALSC